MKESNLKRFFTRTGCVLLALVLCIGILPTFSHADGAELKAFSTQDNGCPYYIMVNRKMNTVTVYGLDENGYYTVPVKAMVCSTGRTGHKTPLGSFKLTNTRKEWCYMVDGSYGQYSVQFSGHYLFHSICYKRADPSTLLVNEYDALGECASLGCVRLQTIDAKWIFDNCCAGTNVTIYESDDPGALGKPQKLISSLTPFNNGWDPTDPKDNNPWRDRMAREIVLSSDKITLTAGDTCQITANFLPEDAINKTAAWSSDNSTVVSVSANGTITALGAGIAVIKADCGSTSAECTVEVTGKLLPFSDLKPGAWYYADTRFVWENGILNGVSDGKFAPDGNVTVAQAIQILYNMSDSVQDSEAEFQDVWYGKALRWAKNAGILEGMDCENFLPNRIVSRQEMAELLYRYEKLVIGNDVTVSGSLKAFRDAEDVHAFSGTAVIWAVERGLLKGDADLNLKPNDSLTRVQLSAIIHRYLDSFRTVTQSTVRSTVQGDIQDDITVQEEQNIEQEVIPE